MLATKLCLIVLIVHTCSTNGNPFKIFKRHHVPGLDGLMSPRQGRNSKLMSFANGPEQPADAPALALTAEDEQSAENDTVEERSEATDEVADTKAESGTAVEEVNEKEVEEEEEFEDKLANASLIDLEDSVTEVMINSLLGELTNQEDRGGKDHEDKIGLTGEQPDFVLQQKEGVAKEKLSSKLSNLPQSPVFQFKQQNPPVSNYNQFSSNYQQQPGQASPAIQPQQPNFYPDQYEQFKQFQALQRQQQLQQQQQGQFAPQTQQFQQQFNRPTYGNAQPRSTSGLSSDFGPAMGQDLVDQNPEDDDLAGQPQLDQRVVGQRQNLDAGDDNLLTLVTPDADSDAFPTAPSGPADLNEDDESATADVDSASNENNAASGNGEDDQVRCINKVMQVEETVYEERIKCQHTFTEKCHDTFITDYVPTQEKKCETSFKKNCHITYKPMMFEESVKVCNEPLQKVCSDDTVGEEVCKTHYETICETRYKEHEVEQDEPVCEMVVERKCNGVTVPLPPSEGSVRGFNSRSRRQAPQLIDGEFSGNDLSSDLGFLENQDLATIGEECEDWPIQKCRLEKRTVKKTNPETSCQKMPREICAPSNCIFQKSDKVCRDENRNLVQNIPSEQCDLEPQENCKMETVLVPRLTKQPNCIKVPKEICVNAKTNPRKVKRPVIKEWCYKPSDLQTPSSRLALSQFFKQ